MTVFRRGVQRINNIVVKHLFEWQQPLTRTPCASLADCENTFPYRHMHVIFTENWPAW